MFVICCMFNAVMLYVCNVCNVTICYSILLLFQIWYLNTNNTKKQLPKMRENLMKRKKKKWLKLMGIPPYPTPPAPLYHNQSWRPSNLSMFSSICCKSNENCHLSRTLNLTLRSINALSKCLSFWLYITIWLSSYNTKVSRLIFILQYAITTKKKI